MKSQLILAASLALAIAAPAFAQDGTQSMPASPASDQASADSQPMSSDAQQAPMPMRHRHVMHRRMMSQGHNPAAERLTGNEPGTAAYQASNREKSYPAVDHGHVSGDPPVIDHSGDHAPVANPTSATITVPPVR